MEIDRVSLFHKVAVSYYPSYVEEEAIHAVDETIPVKAITAYVYEEFLQNLNKDFAKREGLLFVGGFAHPPNADAVLWFAKEVFPKIREQIKVNFYIARFQSNRRDQSAGTAWKRHHRQRFCK